MSEDEKKQDFDKRTAKFKAKFEALQKELNIGIRPIITPLGPDLQLMDLKQVEEKKDEEIIK